MIPMHPHLISQLIAARQADLMARARQQRLAQQARASRRARPTQREAKDHDAKIRTGLARGTHVDTSNRTTVAEYFARWLADRVLRYGSGSGDPDRCQGSGGGRTLTLAEFGEALRRRKGL